MEQKTRGIVLRTVKYGDQKIIVDLLSREEGRLSCVCKVGTSAKSKFRRQLFQPLTILEFVAERSPRQPLGQLREARLAVPYTSIPFDGAKLSIAFFLAEFLSFATRDMHTDSTLYDFVEQSLAWLDMSDRGIANFHLMFIMRLSRFLGFFPDTDSYTSGALFDLREGRFTSVAPFHTDFLKPEDAGRMLTLIRMSPSNLHLFQMSRHDRNRTVDLILHFYRLHIPAFGEMKTLKVLREDSI